MTTYLAYLDEFGHVGPYVGRQHPRYNTSPVFGFAGLVLPVDEVRGFGTWFFQRKCQLLHFELARSGEHNSNRVYTRVLLEAVKRIDQFCEFDCIPSANFLLALDEHDQRSALITEVSRSRYAGPPPRRRLIEPLFNLESHRYQTIQAADWIAGLVGRLGVNWADPAAYPENAVFCRYFEQRLKRVTRRSGIRLRTPPRAPVRM